MPGGKKKQTTERTSEQEQQTERESTLAQSASGSSSSSRNPFEASAPLLQNILSQAGGLFGSSDLTNAETTALGGIAGTGVNTAGFAPQVAGLLRNMISGNTSVGHNASRVAGALSPIVNGDFIDPSKNPVLQDALQRGQRDAQDAVTSRFSAGGRNFSPAEARAMAEGVADVNARTNLTAYQNETQRQLQAAGLLNSTAAGALDAQTGAIGLVPALTGLEQSPFRSQLEAEALRRGIPAQNLGMLSNIVLPIAQGFGTTENSHSSETNQTSSGTSSATSTGTQIGTQSGKDGINPIQTGIGAAISIAGLLSGNPMLAASGLGTAASGLGGGGGSATGNPTSLLPTNPNASFAPGSLY